MEPNEQEMQREALRKEAAHDAMLAQRLAALDEDESAPVSLDEMLASHGLS